MITSISCPDFEFGVHHPSIYICPQSINAARYTKGVVDERCDEGDPKGVIVVRLVGDRDWFRLADGAPVKVRVLRELT